MDLFDKKRALDYILDVAYEKKVSQAKLIDGIYDYSHFNRMCNGKETINIEIIFLCAKKLGIDLNKLLKHANNESYVELVSLKEEFKWLTLRQDYSGIKKLYQYISEISNENIEFKQFKMRIEGMMSGQIEKKYNKALKILISSLELTVKFKNIEDINFHLLSDEELAIVNDIALCYNALEDMSCVVLMKKMINDLYFDDTNMEQYIKFYYNLSLMYSHFRDYKNMELITTEGIEIALKCNDFVNLSYLYYNRFIAQICLNNKNNALIDLDNSYVIFKLQNRLELFRKVLLADIEKYHIRMNLSIYF